MAYSARPEQVAWGVLLTALVLFVVIVLGTRSAVQWFVDSATVEAPVYIEIVAGGTVLVQRAGSEQPVGVIRGVFPLRIGDRVRTDANSRALIVFSDRSTAELRPETGLTIVDARAGRFRAELLTLHLRMESGRARFNVALPVGLERQFVVEAPGTTLRLDEGSYLVELGREGIELVAYHGGGRVYTPKATFSLLGGERVVLRDQGAPIGPVPLGKDLVANGDFTSGFDGLEFWIVRPLPDGAEPDEVRVVPSENGRRALHFLRHPSAQEYERVVTQPLDHDVVDAQALELVLDAKIAAAAVSSGSAEPRAPLTLSIKYRDATGREQTWTHRFVVSDGPQAQPRTTAVDLDTWLRFEQDLLQPEVGPRPIHLYELSLIAAGRVYDVWIEQVRLVAR